MDSYEQRDGSPRSMESDRRGRADGTGTTGAGEAAAAVPGPRSKPASVRRTSRPTAKSQAERGLRTGCPS